LGQSPGDNPSDPTTLDLLEEIVHHTLQSGHVPEAWDIYWNRIGGYENLVWRLGAYERGERICRAFAGGEPPESCFSLREKSILFAERTTTKSPYLALPETEQAVFINEWALYLTGLGRLATAARCFEFHLEMRMQPEDWKNASFGNQNLCNVWLQSGRLKGPAGKGALSTAAEALRLAERTDDAKGRSGSDAYRAAARKSRGDVPGAVADFRAALDWQQEVDGDDDPLYGKRGVDHTHLLARLGRCEEATRLTEANKEICLKEFGAGGYDPYTPQCNLVLSDLPHESIEASSRESLCRSARDWAVTRNAKEVLCWSALVQARLELERARSAQAAITEGLKIARDCGFGLYHIDLLLERARLHLVRGDPQTALNDIGIALDSGIPANNKTGQPVLLAANDKECGYAWAIPAGLHVRAEAQLLRAAQIIGDPTHRPGSRKTPDGSRELIKQAKSDLQKAMRRWKKLRDPEPTEDNNFKHPDTGEEYNYRAAETFRVLSDLSDGVLTRYPLQTQPTTPMDQEPPKVFVSHSSLDKPFVRQLVDELQEHNVQVWFDERQLDVGDSIVDGINTGLSEADYLLVVLSKNSVESNWVKNELNFALMEEASKKAIVVLPAVINDCEVPPLLKDRKYADFSDNFAGGIRNLLQVFAHETQTAGGAPQTLESTRGDDDCPSELSALRLAELRRRMTKRMSREDLSTVWFDVFETKMDNDMKNRSLVECVIELLDRANNRNQIGLVIETLCAERADLASP